MALFSLRSIRWVLSVSVYSLPLERMTQKCSAQYAFSFSSNCGRGRYRFPNLRNVPCHTLPTTLQESPCLNFLRKE